MTTRAGGAGEPGETRKVRWGPRRAVALLGLLLCAPTLGQPADTRGPQSVVEQARRSVDEAADRARRAVERYTAASATTRTREGISVFTPDAPGAWTPLAPGAPTPDRIVLLIHGLDEPGSIWDDLAPALRAGDRPDAYAVARFDYPNDQSAAMSAPLLSAALRELARTGTTRVDLVCHSMGGLIARDVLTRAPDYAGDARAHAELPAVERLIMVGTPHTGSPWAKLRAIGEIREQIARFWNDPKHDARGLLGYLNDGLGEAGDDLLPGSPYIKGLNSRPLPTGVATTIIAGRLAPVQDDDLKWLSESYIVRWLLGAEDAAAMGQGIKDLSTQLGDGVVPATSAVLPGVEDTVFVEANHRSMLKSIRFIHTARELAGAETHAPPAIPIILERLSRPACPTSDR